MPDATTCDTVHISPTETAHRLLILGSMHEFCELVRLAHARGWWCAVADGYPTGPAKQLADASFDIDIRNTRELAHIIERHQIDGCISSYSDILFENLCELTHATNLYSYCPLAGMHKLRDKRLMNQMLSDAGATRPITRIVHREHIVSDCEGLRWPCVIKPVDGYGSYGIRVVANAHEAEEAFDAAIAAGAAQEALIEEYDDAPEINMIAWVTHGEVVPISLADRQKCPLVAGGVPDVVRILYPSRYTNDAVRPAVELLQKVARATGIQDGPLSMQFFWHAEEQRMNICEVAGRVLGYEHELVQIGSGLSIDELLLDLTYDRDAMHKRLTAHRLENFSGVSFVLNFHARADAHGSVGDLTKAHALTSSSPALWPSTMHYDQGEQVRHGRGAKPYLARIFCHTSTRDEADQLTARYFSEFSVKSTSGEELCAKQSLACIEG